MQAMQCTKCTTGGPMSQVCRIGPKVGSHLALFCIHLVNRVNSHNDWVIITAP